MANHSELAQEKNEIILPSLSNTLLLQMNKWSSREEKTLKNMQKMI